jgi:hypothetical protein
MKGEILRKSKIEVVAIPMLQVSFIQVQEFNSLQARGSAKIMGAISTVLF